MSARYIVGDVLEQLRKLPDDSVDLVFSSPPFLALRSYLPPDHPDKAKEIGSEPTPGEFLDALLDVTEECDRVLAPHGSLCFELGDTYSGSGGHGGDYEKGGLRDGQPKFAGSAKQGRDGKSYGTGTAPRPARSNRPKYQDVGKGDGRRNRPEDEAAGILQARTRGGPAQRDFVPGWPLDKSLSLVPELYRVALAYGFNPLTGRQTEAWRIRNVVRWCRPNPPVGSLADKVRPATSDIVVACKSRTRFFDLDAVRTEPAHGYVSTRRAPNHREIPEQPLNKCNPLNDDGLRIDSNPGGAPPLDHWWIDDDTFDQDAWLIPTAPYKGSHYATFPPALVIKPVLSMCPERVCTVCGEPSRRITGDPEYKPSASFRGGSLIADAERAAPGVNAFKSAASVVRTAETIGWTDCGHDSWRPGVVLDPFAGSGTTLSVATGHGRDAIGIDLDERNADLAQQRVGMFLTVERPEFAA